MIAKKVKEMLAGVPDDAEIIVSMEEDGGVTSSNELALSMDSKTKAYCIECNAWKNEEQLVEKDEMNRKYGLNLKDDLLSDYSEKKVYVITDDFCGLDEFISGVTDNLETAKEQATTMAKEHCSLHIRLCMQEYKPIEVRPRRYFVNEYLCNDFKRGNKHTVWTISSDNVLNEVLEEFQNEDTYREWFSYRLKKFFHDLNFKKF